MNKLLASFLIDTVTPRGVSDSKVIISIEQYRKCGVNITVQMYPCSEGTDTGNPVL